LIWSVKKWAVYGHNAVKNGRTPGQACRFLRALHVQFVQMAIAQQVASVCGGTYSDYMVEEELYL